jgi:hypothetical protein
MICVVMLISHPLGPARMIYYMPQRQKKNVEDYREISMISEGSELPSAEHANSWIHFTT